MIDMKEATEKIKGFKAGIPEYKPSGLHKSNKKFTIEYKAIIPIPESSNAIYFTGQIKNISNLADAEGLIFRDLRQHMEVNWTVEEQGAEPEQLGLREATNEANTL